MIFASLASSSSGNCTFLSTGTENILIDCGLSTKKIGGMLAELGFSLSDLDAVLLTHEHIDHIKGLKRLMSTFQIPVYCSYGTFSSLSAVTKDEYFRFQGKELFRQVNADSEFYIGNTLVLPFRTYHDTPGPLGYRFEITEPLFGKEESVCVLTDCGHYDDYIRSRLQGLTTLLIEANHDPDLLMRGPYPMVLKRRILSDFGHSSNASCARLLKDIYSPALKTVLLGHLSEENNRPELALSCVRSVFPEKSPEIYVAPKSDFSKIIT